MRRVFIAINLPERVKQELEKIKNEIEDSLPEQGIAKWVKTDNLHLTLVFVGYVKDERIPSICQNVKEAAQGIKPFSLKLQRVCYGPPKKMPPRLIWVELEHDKELGQLVERLGAMENRAFSPHITLARIRTWQWKQIEPEQRPEIEREIDLEFEVESVEVMESVLRRTGPEYTILQSFEV